ncbi:retinol dehydrogenase 11-like [Macrosteles quadrilineatus]|uniref:retinol dehydrogenase 11-like n=1 Tax=Macrosteles quadrilineatus TaxID=74068 RepID=UPI0023E1D436|nr:retinol dehydrogenase 11-like [Macrosteles quadrilineatus]XP_054272941.1 retinol dehydrogenase 11-like [Macrosteles quadrilineatus]
MGWFWNGKCSSKVRLEGKTAVITGCNTGIGKYTVLDLYLRGARVVMACRDVSKAETAREWVLQQSKDKEGAGEISVCHLDLSSLNSVRQCAQKILDEEKNIHLLINNAGVMMCPRSVTEDGYELQFATNHLGHFLFTLILLPKIISSAPARIVNVASMAHILCRSMYFDDINMENCGFYTPQKSYARSKMANILFTRELARRLKDTGVTAYSLHPGVVDTELSRHLDKTIFPGARWFFHNFGGMFMKSPLQGAQTTLYCALEESLAQESGLYYDDCQVAKTTSMGRDDELAKKLWDVSLDMVKYSPPPPFGKSA